MGISRLFAKAIMREHSYRPLSGEVWLAGRQSVLIERDQLADFYQECGFIFSGDFSALEMDSTTVASAGHEFITDRAFFKAIGLNSVKAVDVTDYEEADIVHDICTPVPLDLVSCADVLVDGSTLDNVFDPSAALRNFVTMLKPGGRMFLWNTGSNHNCPYIILTPFWFYDYLVLAGFIRIGVYVIVEFSEGTAVLALEPVVEKMVPPHFVPNVMYNGCKTSILVVAEKGSAGDPTASPVQHQYRNAAAWEEYLTRSREIAFGPDLIQSDPAVKGAFTASGGYRLVCKGGGGQ